MNQWHGVRETHHHHKGLRNPTDQLTRDHNMIKTIYIYIAFMAAAGFKLYMMAEQLIHSLHPLGG